MDSSYSALPDGEDGQTNGESLDRSTVKANCDSKVVALLDGKNKWTAEAKAQWSLAWPIMLAGLSAFSFIVVTVTFVGHLGELELSSAAIAYSIANVTGFSIMLGLALGVETLAGQSYGAEDFARLGVHLQAAAIVTLLTCIPIGIFWWNLEPVLVWSGQDRQISRMAASYLRYNIPGLISAALFHPFMRFLQVQSQVMPMLVCSVVAAILHPLVCYLLIYNLGFGYTGGAVANSFSNWLLFILLASYTAFSGKCSQTWTGFRFREAVRGIPLFIQLAVPSVIMVCLKLWTFEMLLLMSGRLPKPELELSLFAIALNTTTFIYMIPFGFRASGSTRVSNALGANSPEAAKIATRVALVLTAVQATIVSIVLILTRNSLGFVYTDVKEVANYVAQVMPLLAITIFMDAIQGVLIGILGGCGRQKLGAMVNLGAFYGFGIPIAFTLAFDLHLHGTGLLIGLTSGISLQVIILLISVLSTDWLKWADDAQTRVQHRGQVPRLPSYLERLEST